MARFKHPGVAIELLMPSAPLLLRPLDFNSPMARSYFFTPIQARPRLSWARADIGAFATASLHRERSSFHTRLRLKVRTDKAITSIATPGMKYLLLSLLSAHPAITADTIPARYPLFSCSTALSGIIVVGRSVMKNQRMKNDNTLHSRPRRNNIYAIHNIIRMDTPGNITEAS